MRGTTRSTDRLGCGRLEMRKTQAEWGDAGDEEPLSRHQWGMLEKQT